MLRKARRIVKRVSQMSFFAVTMLAPWMSVIKNTTARTIE